MRSLYRHAAEFYKYRPQWGVDFVRELLSVTSCGKKFSEIVVADIGSGGGESTEVLIAAGCDKKLVYGVEPSAEMRKNSKIANVVDGSASATGLPGDFCDVLTFFNSAHRVCATTDEIFVVQDEMRRVLKGDGKVVIAAQRFNPESEFVRELHKFCEYLRNKGLYEDYGKFGHLFVFDEGLSGRENAKGIVTDEMLSLFIEKDGQEEVICENKSFYDRESFEGLLQSYLSFPKPPSLALIDAVRGFHGAYCDADGMVGVSCMQLGVVGNLRQRLRGVVPEGASVLGGAGNERGA